MIQFIANTCSKKMDEYLYLSRVDQTIVK